MIYDIPLNGVQNTIADNMPSAVMWIISPRQYSNQAKRPLLYRFDGRFYNEAEEAVARMAEQHSKTKIDEITSSAHWINTATMPSTNYSHHLDMQRMAHLWTFVLIVNNDKTGSGGIIRANADCQHLYSGFFVDEPINPMMHMGQQTLNPNANIIITHKTLINKHSTFGSFGSGKRVDVQSDIDVVHPYFISTLDTTQSGLSLIRPEDLYPNTTDDIDPVIMHSTEALLHNQGDPVRLSSNFAVPRHNVSSILYGVAGARSSMGAESTSGRIFYHDRESYRSMVELNLKDRVTLHDTTGLPINSAITLGSVISRYNPKIEPIKQDIHPRYTPMDQVTTSAQTIFSTMLSTAVPALMSEFALAEISFCYDSYNQAFELNQGIQPAPLSPMPAEDVIRRVQGFRYRLINEILPIPKLNRGDFVLYMTCTCFGVTTININFLDDSIHTPEVFEVPTIMGGFNSPMIGNDVVFANNAREISSLIGALVKNDTDHPTIDQYTEKRFNSGLISHDQNVSTQPGTQPTTYRC